MNLPNILNDGSELTKKHATFDQPFYMSVGGNSNMLNRASANASNENLFLPGGETSSIYDLVKA